MIALDSRPSRSQQVLAQPNAESLILLNPEDGQYYTLDEVGARVWELCDGTHAVTDVVSAIYAEYDAPLAAIQGDVVELLDDLTRENLLATS